MTPVAVNMREAEESDVAAVLDLYEDSEVDAGYRMPEEKAQRLFRRMKEYPYLKLFVAELDGRVVGTYELLVMDNLAHDGAPSAVVEDVVVAEDCRSQGIGRAMMGHAIEVCRGLGCYKVSLSSAQHRERAHHFYDNLGVERYGIAFAVGPWDPRLTGTPASA